MDGHQGCLGSQVLQAAQHATPKMRLRLVRREAGGGETSAEGACVRLVMGRMVLWEMQVSVQVLHVHVYTEGRGRHRARRGRVEHAGMRLWASWV